MVSKQIQTNNNNQKVTVQLNYANGTKPPASKKHPKKNERVPSRSDAQPGAYLGSGDIPDQQIDQASTLNMLPRYFDSAYTNPPSQFKPLGSSGSLTSKKKLAKTQSM